MSGTISAAFKKKRAKSDDSNKSLNFKVKKRNRPSVTKSLRRKSSVESSISSPQHTHTDDYFKLSNWGLPMQLTRWYSTKGITDLFEWQAECLCKGKTLEGGNLIYSAPTSAGKTMVAEILMYKQLLEKRRKAMIILPFVSITREKMLFLKQGLKRVSIKVDAFAGNVHPRGGFARVDVAVCTIEKANNMINKLIEENKLKDVGIIVVDELHMLGDSSRGYLLELLLTKVIYLNRKHNYGIQIIGMSATLPNLSYIAKWLNAELYLTSFRPVPLLERVAFGNVLYDAKNMTEIRKIDMNDIDVSDSEEAIYLAIETILEGHGTLIFCQTKAMCEKLAKDIATDIYRLGSNKDPISIKSKENGAKLREISRNCHEKILEILEQLKRSPAGFDPILERSVKFCVAFHHAGLTIDERNIIENGFREGTLKVLCATTTLSAGVNLPARRVIVRSPYDFRGSLIDVLSYNQMIGRAGRKGIDTIGESILLCSSNDRMKVVELMKSEPKPIASCLIRRLSGDSTQTSNSAQIVTSALKRAVLEIIANGIADTYDDVYDYMSCTLFSSSGTDSATENAIDEVLAYLTQNKLLHDMSNDTTKKKTAPTKLAKAVLASAISPDDGLFILEELSKAKKSICLSNDLHLLYEVTPPYVSEQMDIDWNYFLDLWSKLDTELKAVGNLVGVKEFHIIGMIQGQRNNNKLSIMKRFYTALALYDLIHEIPLHDVSVKFRCSKGLLQSLQQSASSFAGMITVFCNRLGWNNLEILFEQFQSRLYFGIQRELIDLMRITCLTASIARHLFNRGFDTVAALACSSVADIELHLKNSGPFQKNTETFDQNSKIVWVAGQCKPMNEKEISMEIVTEARELVQKDLGINIEKWSQNSQSDTSPMTSSKGSSPKAASLKGPVKDKPKKSIISKPVNVPESVPNTSRNDVSFIVMKDEEISETSDINQNSLIDLLSPMQTDFKDFRDSVTSTPLVHTHLKEKSNIIDNKCQILDNVIKPYGDENCVIKNIRKNSDSISFGDSLEGDYSWDRIEREANDKVMKTQSDVNADKRTTLEIQNDCDYLIENSNYNDGAESNNSNISDRSSKRLLSPCLSEKMFGPPTKRLSQENVEFKENCGFISNISLEIEGAFVEENSNNFSDSMEGSVILRERTPSLETIIFPDSPSPVAVKFNEIKIGERIKKIPVDTDCPLLDTVIDNFMLKDNFSIIFDIEKSEFKSKKLIGSEFRKAQTQVPTEPNGLNLNINNQIVKSLTVCFDGELNVYYITSRVALHKVKSKLPLIIKNNPRIITFDVKRTFQVFMNSFEIDPYNLVNNFQWNDPLIAHWLFDPETNRPLKVTQLVKLYNPHFNYLIPMKNDMISEQCVSACLLFPLINTLNEKLENDHLYSAYQNIEIPSRLTLAQMESIGVGIDREYTEKQEYLLNDAKQQLEAKIFKFAKRQFNLSSPEQIANVLYGDLNLLSNLYNDDKEHSLPAAIQRTGKTRTGKLPKHLGTSKAALKKLSNLSNHPLPELIIKWRVVNNALKKSISPILKYAIYNIKLNMWRVSCMFDDWSATGRISTEDPNLIGLNKDFEIKDVTFDEEPCTSTSDGVFFSIRRLLIPSKGYLLVAADYSQLELRILAHLSGDKDLQNVLNDGGDVFKNIASVWKSKLLEEVTNEERQQAKQICYGIIYGIGAKHLSENLGVSEDDAREFRESFKEKYSCVKDFIAKTIEKCIENGFVETMNGRKRFLPNIKSNVSTERSHGERQSVHTTIQGSASDLVKSAMITVNRLLFENRDTINARFVLQMHDELMYEVLEEHCSQFACLLRESMESCSRKLTVYLPVKMKIGPNWGELVERDDL